MTMTVPVVVASWLWWAAERLLAGSLRGALIVIVVWLVCRRIAIVPASARAFLWWAASLAMMTSLLPLPSVPLPLSSALPIAVSNVEDLATPPIGSQVPSEEAVPLWLIAVLAVWLVGVAVQTSRLTVAFVRLQRIVRGSRPLDPEDADVVDRLSGLLGLKKPAVRESDRIVIPMVVGMWRPTVLLPTGGITVLSSDERVMAICHELAHVRRGDLVFGWVPAIAERLFFFHPLARFAAREYVAEREAACDALVLRLMDIAPRAYGAMLVHLGVGGFRPAFTANGSSPSMSSLRRRLAMLNDLTSSRTRRGAFALLAVAAPLIVVPMHVTVQRTAAASTPRAALQQAAEPVAPLEPVAPQERTAKPPKAAAPVAPPKKAGPDDERRVEQEQLQAEIAYRRASVQDLEKALNQVRAELRALLARDQASRLRDASEMPSAVRRFLEGPREPQRAAEREHTETFLEIQLKALSVEQEKTREALRQLSDQVEQIRRQLEAARSVKP
ncbi:MAG TPA: M56 family metallopeptidase [Vicinamibacterales bacterium]|jgi:beta-lactamase regulating signal transducer with metallopeptidase domain